MKLTKCFIAGECLYNKRRKEKTMENIECVESPVRADYDKLKAERDELVRKLADSEKACHELWESATDRDMSLIKERDTAVKALGMALEQLIKIESELHSQHNNAAYDMSKAETNHDRERFEVIWRGLARAWKQTKRLMDQIKSLGIVPVSVEGGEASG